MHTTRNCVEVWSWYM